MLRLTYSPQSGMEVCESIDSYITEGDDHIFDETKIILRKGEDEYFYAKSSQPLRPAEVDIDTLDAVAIPMKHIWPLADPTFTRAPEPVPENCYLKRKSVLDYEDGSDAIGFGDTILAEVEACEVLRKHPHPNIVQYLGCVIKDGRVRALAFNKHSVTLRDMVKAKTPFDKNRCLDAIEAGVRHMHDLGLIHNDLNPSNIMMDGNNPIIIDFDSCKPEGQKMIKGGTYGYSLPEEYSKRSNDVYGLSRMRESVMEEKIFNEV
jgi:serine/threonine protein kinase